MPRRLSIPKQQALVAQRRASGLTLSQRNGVPLTSLHGGQPLSVELAFAHAAEHPHEQRHPTRPWLKSTM